MLENLSDIRLLPTELSNQIAAGEVVERPASVVKELIENSLDAGATQIDICLENGGQSLIRVQDNGWGIAPDQLELAVTRHATSKIASVDDLDNISSYGFRGEALPSIASVSRFRLVSRRKNQADQETASCLEVEYGSISRTSIASLPSGTLIEVRDLFASTPARLKFLKSPVTELKKAQTWLIRLALANRHVGFRFSAGDREIMRFLPGEDLRYRLSRIWPNELVDELLTIDTDAHGIRLTGVAGPPQLRQPKADRVHFFVNGRAVNDKRLMTAVREAYKGRIISRDYPQLILFVDINPMEIDVNVHPAKTEVRFRNEGALFSAVAAALGQAFQSLVHVETYGGFEPHNIEDRMVNTHHPEGFWGLADNPPLIARQEREERGGKWEIGVPEETGLARETLRENTAVYSGFNEICPTETTASPLENALPDRSLDTGLQYGKGETLHYLGQIATTYLVLRDESGALLLLDQHAAHERVLFHRFSQKRSVSSLNLIIPLELHVTEDQKGLIRKLSDTLCAFGFKFHIEKNKLIVKSVPDLLTRGESREFLMEVLNERMGSPDALFISMACRGAIKAGQTLSPDEAHELIRQWQQTPMAEFCPHGRPCVLRWDATALEKLFKRR